MASRSSTVDSATGSSAVVSPLADPPAVPDLESDLSVERRKVMLVRLPNHFRPWDMEEEHQVRELFGDTKETAEHTVVVSTVWRSRQVQR